MNTFKTIHELKEDQPSQLRQDFEEMEGVLLTRGIMFSSEVIIFQVKKNFNSNLVYIETIFPNEDPIKEFHDFLEMKIEIVPAEGFSNLPKIYRTYFQTERIYFPVIVEETVIDVPNKTNGGGSKQKLERKVQGVDLDSPCLLEVINPEEVLIKLEEMEKEHDFDVRIARIRGVFEIQTFNPEKVELSEIKSFEFRKKRGQLLRHLVFRK